MYIIRSYNIIIYCSVIGLFAAVMALPLLPVLRRLRLSEVSRGEWLSIVLIVSIVLLLLLLLLLLLPIIITTTTTTITRERSARGPVGEMHVCQKCMFSQALKVM